MAESFFIVFRQVFILFIMVVIGIISAKAKIIDEKSIKSLTNFVLLFVCPAAIIRSFYRKVNSAQLKSLGIVAIVTFVCFLISILIAYLFIKDKDKSTEKLYRFAVIFSNAGFMGLPLEQALLGDEGVFYGAIYLGVFNIFIWTYGLFMMSSGKERFSVKKILLNPGVVAVCIGLILMISQMKLPEVAVSSLDMLSAMNAPLPMIIIGYYLSLLKKEDFKRWKQYYAIFLRLIVVPVIILPILYFIKMDKTAAMVCLIGAGTPVAAILTMFAAKYDANEKLGATLVSISTIVSLITLPLILGFAETIW
ncbi:MAG: AEC family transporter [Clostridia bacterium]|nr:AEC family transporter [Clostridia bacterium]